MIEPTTAFDDDGDRLPGDTTEETVALIYHELHRLARRRIRDQRPGHTLQATALVNEAFLRLFGADGAPSDIRDREHFIARAATAMRSVLIDHARRKNRDKRKGVVEAVPLDSLTGEFADRAVDLLALDEALSRLAEFDAKMARIVELRFFGGLDSVDIARILGVSRRTVEREFKMAREWLRAELTG